MKRPVLIAALAATAATSALAQGPIGTLERGTFACELPGNAAGRVGLEQPAAGFAIIGASRYSSPQGDGTYLRRGDLVTFTGGPRSGEAYSVISPGFLRRIENGRPGTLRCVLRRD
jgi:hypothetical protein